MNSIEIKNVSKAYEKFLLNDISFNVPKGTIVGLVGENGAGKSTTLKLIMNAIKADKGTISVLGKSNLSKEFEDIKQDIGIVLDEAYFPEVLNIKNINKIMKATYKNWQEDKYFEYINKFSLPKDKKIKEFSRGMKMKLSIAVSLSHKAKLLILDEATGGLDPMIREEVLDIFNEFTRDENNSILISSHIISDLEKICDYIVFINKGNIILSEEKDLLLEKYSILKASEKEFEDIPFEAIKKKRKTNYGYELLVYKDKINSVFNLEYTSLENIVLFMAKEDK